MQTQSLPAALCLAGGVPAAGVQDKITAADLTENLDDKQRR